MDIIKAAIELSNDSYQDGYRAGVLEGKRQMLAEIQALFKDRFEANETSSADRTGT